MSPGAGSNGSRRRPRSPADGHPVAPAPGPSPRSGYAPGPLTTPAGTRIEGDERRHRDALVARCTFAPEGTAVTCAVSGGPDSLALLALAVAAGLEVTAVHVDHGLRPGSGREAEVVEAAAERFGARFSARRVTVRATCRSAESPVPPGRMNEFRAGSASLYSSHQRSRRSI